eukprot:jgi/Orpsp1_1/1178352/evm.model.c7180000064974.1
MILSGSEEEKLFDAIEYRNVEIVKSVLKNSTQNKKILKLNEKDRYGDYPLLCAIENGGRYPLVVAIRENRIESVKLLIEYANQHQIILEYDKSDLYLRDKPEIQKILENYENEKGMEKWKKDEEKLLDAIFNNNIEKVKSILNNSTKNKEILNLNEEDEYGMKQLLSEAINSNNIEIIQLLIEYANQNQIILELNEKDIYGDYPFLYAIEKDNIEIVKLLIKYANQHQIILELNEKVRCGEYPLFIAVCNNNIEMVQLLIDYANQHEIILELNEKNLLRRDYPLYLAILIIILK